MDGAVLDGYVWLVCCACGEYWGGVLGPVERVWFCSFFFFLTVGVSVGLSSQLGHGFG